MSARTVTIGALVALLFTSAPTADAVAAQTPERDPYWSAGVGAGVFVFLPTLRLSARYALDDVSFDVRAGVFLPAFAIGELVYEVAAGPRFHFLERKNIVGFAAARVGFWDIGPPSDPEDPQLSVAADGGTRRFLNPLVSVVGGADVFFGSFVFTGELGGGVVWGQRFNGSDAPAPFIPIIEINTYLGWVF